MSDNSSETSSEEEEEKKDLISHLDVDDDTIDPILYRKSMPDDIGGVAKHKRSLTLLVIEDIQS